MISEQDGHAIIADLQAHKTDVGSSSVQVGLLTKRIAELTDHLKKNPKDHAARRGLLQMVGKRRSLLLYISQQNSQQYLDLIKKLGIRR